MNTDPLYRASFPAAAATDKAVADFFRLVYAWMALGLAVTGVVAFGIAATPGLWPILFGGPQLWLFVFAPLVVVMAMGAMSDRLSVGATFGLFMVLSVLYGITFSVLALIYTLGSIGRAFLITAGSFGALSVYGMVTKRNLSGMGQFMLIGMFGLIIAGVVNIFLASDALSWVLSVITVVVFAGLTAYKTQELRAYALSHGAALETPEARKYAIFGALNLYIAFIAMFQAILRLTGQRR
jgi:uncharacterized protein